MIRINNGPLIVALIFNLGSNIEFESQCGYTHILEHYFLNLSQKGTSDLLVQAYTESDHMEIRFISKLNSVTKLKEILGLVNSLLSHQNYDKAVLEKSKMEVLHEIKNKGMRTEEVILQTVSGNMYHLPLGDFNAVENITFDKFIEFSKDFLACSDFLLWVYGNVTAEILQNYVKETIKFKVQPYLTNLCNHNLPQWSAYQDSVSIPSSVHHIILHDILNVSSVYNKSIQMLGDEIIERIAAESRMVKNLTISHKNISPELKIMIITLEHLLDHGKVMSLQCLGDFIYQHLTDEAIIKVKREIIKWLNNTKKVGFKAIQLLDDRKRHFLYNEYSIYDREALEILINQMYKLEYLDIKHYIQNVAQLPNIIIAN